MTKLQTHAKQQYYEYFFFTKFKKDKIMNSFKMSVCKLQKKNVILRKLQIQVNEYS